MTYPNIDKDTNQSVHFWRINGIAHIRFNRPKSLNSINIELAQGFLLACKTIEDDPLVRVVIVSSEGKNFMAGGDLQAMKADPVSISKNLIKHMHSAIMILDGLGAPVIASVQGACAGGGLGVAVACDWIVASDNARFNFAYTSIGASPDCSTSWGLPRSVGTRKALELAMLCETVNADEALKIGLINQIIPNENLQEVTLKIAEKLEHCAPQALRRIKRLIKDSTLTGLTQHLTAEAKNFLECASGSDFTEGVSAFFEKRTPNFKGAEVEPKDPMLAKMLLEIERNDSPIYTFKLNEQLAVISIHSPKKMNALNTNSMTELRQQIAKLNDDPSVRVIILRGHAGNFCTGLDLKSLLDENQNYNLSVHQAYELQKCFEGSVRALRQSTKIIIAAVDGVAVGAGFALSLAADIRFASQTASFHIGAVKMGLSAGECGISYHLPKLIGAARAFEVMLTGRAIEASEALGIGLIADIVPSTHLMSRAIQCANDILSNSPYSTQETKKIMWTNLNAPSLESALELENHTQVQALMTKDFAEAAKAFAQKRAPLFIGK